MSKCISNLTVDPLTVDCWSFPPQSTVNSVDCRSPHCWPLTLSLLTVDHQSPHCWLLTLSLLTVDPPWDQQSTVLIINHLIVDRQPSHCWLLIVDRFTVDHRPSHCWSFVTFHVHFVENNEISVPSRHSVRSKGWPLVFLMQRNLEHAHFVNLKCTIYNAFKVARPFIFALQYLSSEIFYVWLNFLFETLEEIMCRYGLVDRLVPSKSILCVFSQVFAFEM